MKKTNKKVIGIAMILAVAAIVVAVFGYKVEAQSRAFDAELDSYVGGVVANNLRCKLVKEYGDDYSFITRYLGDGDYELTVVDYYDCYIITFHADDTKELVNLDSEELCLWLEDHLVDVVMVYDDIQYDYDQAVAYGLIER